MNDSTLLEAETREAIDENLQFAGLEIDDKTLFSSGLLIVTNFSNRTIDSYMKGSEAVNSLGSQIFRLPSQVRH